MKPPHAGWIVVGALVLLVATTALATVMVAERLYENARRHAYADAVAGLDALQRQQERCRIGEIRCVYLTWPLDTARRPGKAGAPR